MFIDIRITWIVKISRVIHQPDSHRAIGETRFQDIDILVVHSQRNQKPNIFSDFQCPACKRAAEKAAKDIESEFADRIRVVWKHYPLSIKCNPNAGRDLHPDSCEAAYASEAARIQGGQEVFWKFHDLLFANQARIPKLDYRHVAVQLGLDPEKFIADMQSSAVKNRVREDIDLGKSLDIKSTPGMFLGGRPLPSYMFYNPLFMDAIKKMVDQSVNQRAGRSPAKGKTATNGPDGRSDASEEKSDDQ